MERRALLRAGIAGGLAATGLGALADPALAESITIRHLLSHTSGLEGEMQADGGRGDRDPWG